jgi:type III secretion protein R
MVLSSTPLFWMVVIVVSAVAPFLALAVTSFLKLSVVFSIFRNALGAQQVPSGAVVGLLSLVLSFHIMAPGGREMMAVLEGEIKTLGQKASPQQQLSSLLRIGRKVALPLEEFLQRHSERREREFFAKTGRSPQEKAAEDLTTLVPAFVLSELKEAFIIGFAIYHPFLVVDLVVINVLIGLGMVMVSPITIALPLKLILFVLCDGWFLLCRGLMLGYQ